MTVVAACKKEAVAGRRELGAEAQDSEFVFFCSDAQGAADRRRRALPAHRRYIESVIERVRLAGPLLGDDGNIVGSLYIVAAGSAAAAWQLIHEDPFHAGEIWESVTMRRVVGAAGTLLGGVSWPRQE